MRGCVNRLATGRVLPCPDLFDLTSTCFALSCLMLFYVVLCCFVHMCVKLCLDMVLYHGVCRYAVLWCVVLFYVVLCRAVMWCFVPFRGVLPCVVVSFDSLFNFVHFCYMF